MEKLIKVLQQQIASQDCRYEEQQRHYEESKQEQQLHYEEQLQVLKDLIRGRKQDGD